MERARNVDTVCATQRGFIIARNPNALWCGALVLVVFAISPDPIRTLMDSLRNPI